MRPQPSLFTDTDCDDYFSGLCRELDVKQESGWPDQFGQALSDHAQFSNRIRTLSLFSGAGGLDIGFHDAGFAIETLVEIEERFVRTLHENSGEGKYLGRCKPLCVDVRDYVPRDSSLDFVIGGPPCQSFSAAARRASGVRGVNDARGTLFQEYVRILRALKPRGFLFENVYGITGANAGSAWASIREAFAKIGYRVHHRIIDSADYGAPQHRERMFIVGTRGEEYRFPRPTHGPDSRARRDYYTAGMATLTAPRDGEAPPPVGGRYGGLLEQVPPGLNYSFFTQEMGHPNPFFAWRSKFSDFLYKADPDAPTRTLKAQGGQYTGPFHWDSRPFSVTELKRLQTIPDSYAIVGGRQAAICQIGNSVPPQVARMLALSVRDQIFGVAPPQPIDYLAPTEELGFRSRKRLLTAKYRRAAARAIAAAPEAEVPKSLRQSYMARLSPALEFSRVSEAREGDLQVRIRQDARQLHIRLHDAGQRASSAAAFTCDVEPSAGASWSIPCERIRLSGASLDKANFTGAWKALELFLREHGLKADLVQLNGYYSYEPSISIRCRILAERVRPQWRTVMQVCNAVGVRRTLPADELSDLWGLPRRSLLSHLQFLRALGYEPRNHNTNPEIPKENVLVPYAFPTLNPKSVQLGKSLFQSTPRRPTRSTTS